MYDAFFNTFRRSKSQIFYWAPALAGGYWLMHWATERYAKRGDSSLQETKQSKADWRFRNEYLNSKAGRAEFSEEE